MLNRLANEIKEEIIEKIECMDRNENWDLNDFAFQLWEEEVINGSCTFSRIKSMEWIKYHFHDIGAYVNEDIKCNLFLHPEEFQVIISMEVTKNLLRQVWKEGISSEELIRRLKEL